MRISQAIQAATERRKNKPVWGKNIIAIVSGGGGKAMFPPTWRWHWQRERRRLMDADIYDRASILCFGVCGEGPDEGSRWQGANCAD